MTLAFIFCIYGDDTSAGTRSSISSTCISEEAAQDGRRVFICCCRSAAVPHTPEQVATREGTGKERAACVHVGGKGEGETHPL